MADLSNLGPRKAIKMSHCTSEKLAHILPSNLATGMATSSVLWSFKNSIRDNLERNLEYTHMCVCYNCCSVVSDSLQPRGLQHVMPPRPSPSPGAYSNSCPLSRWCHPTISSSVVPFSSCPQSFPASGSFPISQLFSSGSQRIVALASVLPVDIQDWSSLAWAGWVSLQPKGLSRVFCNTIVQKQQFFSSQLSL